MAVITQGGAPILRENGSARMGYDPAAPNWFDWGASKVWLESVHPVNGPFHVVVEVAAGVTPPEKAMLFLDAGSYSRGFVFTPVVGNNTVVPDSLSIAADAGVVARLHAIGPAVSGGRVGAQTATAVIEARASAPIIVSAEINGTGFYGTVHTAVVETAGAGTISVALQWMLDDVDVSGATGTTYTPAVGAVGKELTFRATATSTYGSSDPEVSLPLLIAAPTFAVPGSVVFTTATGGSSGQISVIVASPLPAAGDGAVVGDGAATLSKLEYVVDSGVPATLTASPAAGTYTITTTPGATVQVGVRAVSNFAREGAWTFKSATAAGTSSATPPTYLGGLVDLVIESGKSYAFDWDTYFGGATSFTVNSGMTGGVSSNGNHTNDIYTISSPSVEDVVVSVTATNTDGSINRSFRVQVVTPGTVPVLTSTVTERFVVPIGASVTYDVTPHFAGSNLGFFSPDNDSNFALGTAGTFKSLVPLTGAIATATREIVAWNAIGTTLGSNPITTTNASSSVVIAWSGHALVANDWAGISGATAVGGLTLNGAYKVLSVVAGTSITINARANASSGATGGGAAVKAQKAAVDTVSVGVTATPALALTVDEINVAQSVYRYDPWRAPQARLPGAAPLGNNPFTFVNGSASVTVACAGHGLQVGDARTFTGATAAAGLTISGAYTVATVVDADTFKITAAGNANASTSGGGSAVLMRRAQTGASLASAPFSFTSGQSSVTVTWTDHPAGVGRVVEFTGATAAAGLTISGAYVVTEFVGPNSFKIDAGANASSTTTGGGSAVVATLRNHNEPLFLGANPVATTNASATVTIAATGHSLAVGRPVTLSGLATTGGIGASDLNGARTVLGVPDKDHFTFTAGASASSTVASGGGSAGIVLPSWSAMRWSRTTPDTNGVIPDANSEETPNGWQSVGTGRWETHMEDAAKEGNPDFQTPRTDFSVWNAEAGQTFRFAFRETSTSLWSTWSGAAAVPSVSGVVTPVPASAWLPISSRNKEAFEADDPDSRGLQYERVCTWSAATSDARKSWVFGGQDENCIRVSKDEGRTWQSPTVYGLYCSQISGIYHDDDALVVVGEAFGVSGWNGKKPFSGLYVGDPDLHGATRLTLTRDSSTTGPYQSGSSGPKLAFTRCQHGSSNRRSQNCIARRPQTGGLTHAQRPIWIPEHQLADTTNDIVGIYMWKIVLSGVGQVASATMVRTLTLGTYASTDDGIYHIKVAPNGDVMLVGKTGVFISTDEFATAPTKIHPASGDRECSIGHFYGGGASSVSGARIGVYTADANGGVWESANVRTTAFSKPNSNAGLPANYRVWHMGMTGSVLAVCTDGVAPYRSTDGGRNFTKVSEPSRPPSSDEGYRYVIRGKVGGGHSGFHPCPYDPDVWLILTGQTMSRSTDGLDTVDAKGVVFFDGMHDKGWGFGRSDWKQVARVCQDSWVNTGLNGIVWTQENQLGTTGNDAFYAVISGGGGGSNSYLLGNSCLITPGNRVIASCSRDAASYPNVMIILDGRNATNGNYSNYTLRQSGTTSKCFNSKWSPKNDGVGFVGRWAVTNTETADRNDVIFTDHSGHEFIDCALDGSTLVSYWGNFGGTTGSVIYRSTADNGTNGQGAAWHTVSGNYPSRAVAMDHHHATMERVLYVSNSNPSEIRAVVKNGGTVVSDTVLVDLFTMTGGVRAAIENRIGAGAYIPAFKITQLLSSPHMPGLFYAIGGRHGHPNWWMTVDNGVTWTNISDGVPLTIWLGVIHPATGDVIGSSSLGGYCLPPPANHPAIANRGAASKALSDFYNKASVPNPPA